MTMPQGILLFAHGARDPAWARPFEQAFLEFMSPNLLDAGDELAAQGCQRVTVVPLFLGAGGHVRKDLPLLVTQLQQAHPQIDWQLAAAVGETDIVVNALADAAAHLAGLPR